MEPFGSSYLEHKDTMLKDDLETHGFQCGDTLMKSFPFNLCPFILAQFLVYTYLGELLISLPPYLLYILKTSQMLPQSSCATWMSTL